MKSSGRRRAIGTLSLLFACGAALLSRAATDHIERVDIGGRSLQLLTRGEGSPTVVIEAGMGEPGIESGSWRKVMDEISKTNRVLIYDRAGLGKSDPAPKLPRTSGDVASDLNALLEKTGLPGPFLLVGHSYGGLHMRMFASQFPAKVLGMVLVDSTHPDQDEKWLAALPPPTPGEPDSVHRARQFLTERINSSANPESIDSAASSTQVRAAHGLGDKPLVVLCHSADNRVDPSLPEEVSVKIEQVSRQLQEDLTLISSSHVLRQSAHGGHYLQVEDTDLVIQGIRQALTAVKTSSP